MTSGRLKNGNPSGNPHVAPRCGARARRTGAPCRSPAMKNGRCRMHGGRSTGPKTDEGRAKSRRGNWKHGERAAETIAMHRKVSQLIRECKKWMKGGDE
jgi:hypothetical protein